MEIKLPDNEKALWILKTQGSLPLNIVAKELNVTTEGARFQMLRLAGEGLVAATTESKGRGRPQQIWALTASGHGRFPDRHAELTVKLIQKTKGILGESALDAVIEAYGKESRSKYLHAVEGINELEDRIRILAQIRNSEGYMAGYTQEEDGFILFENHCPICAAATICQGFCKSELETFRAILGDTVTVTRIDHVLSSAQRCAYKITL